MTPKRDPTVEDLKASLELCHHENQRLRMRVREQEILIDQLQTIGKHLGETVKELTTRLRELEAKRGG